MLRRSFLLTAGASALSACSEGRDVQTVKGGASGTAIPLRHARYLKLERHDGYTLARLRAPVADQSGGQAQEQEAVLVLAPRAKPEPSLPAALRHATLIRTPVMRIAANASSDEAFLGQLGVKDRLVAVGGRVSFDDDVRRGVIEGRIGQIGYNWHAPPNLDVLLAARPDVFLMRLSDPVHTPVLDRARRLGLIVAPTFAEDEPTYLGRAEWVRLHGLLTGREAEADRLFDQIETRAQVLKAAATVRLPVPTLWALSGWRRSLGRHRPRGGTGVSGRRRRAQPAGSAARPAQMVVRNPGHGTNTSGGGPGAGLDRRRPARSPAAQHRRGGRLASFPRRTIVRQHRAQQSLG